MQGLLRKIDLERQLLATLFLDDDDDKGSGGAAAAAAAAAGEGGPDAPAPTQLEQRQKLVEALGVAFEQVATPLELRVRRLLGATLALPVGYKVSLLLLRRTGELAAAFGRTDAVGVAASAATAPDGSTPAAEEATDAEVAAAGAGVGSGAGEHALVTALRSCSELALSRFESGAPRLHTPRAHNPPRLATPLLHPRPSLPPPRTPPAPTHLSLALAFACAGLSAHLAPLLRTPPRPPADLSAPRALVEPLALLEELMEAQRDAEAPVAGAGDGGGGGGAAAAAEARAGLLACGARALELLVPPLLRICSEAAQLPLHGGSAGSGLSVVLGGGGGGAVAAAAAGGKLSVGERSVFLLNCLDAIQQSLAAQPAEATAVRAAELSEHAEQMVAALAHSTAVAFFERCGLQQKLAALQTAADQPQLQLSSVVGLEPLALAAAMRAFYQQLFRSGGALVERAELVASLALRRRALQRTAQTVAATHRHIHQVVSRQGSGYADLSTILLHTPDEVDTLLDVAAPA